MSAYKAEVTRRKLNESGREGLRERIFSWKLDINIKNMDFISISRESLISLTKSRNHFPREKVVLSQRFVKLKRILIYEKEQEIYGEIYSVTNDEPIKSQIRALPQSVHRTVEEEDDEIITPDDGHSEGAYSNSTSSYSQPGNFAHKSTEESLIPRLKLFPKSIQASSSFPNKIIKPHPPESGGLQNAIETVVKIKEEPIEEYELITHSSNEKGYTSVQDQQTSSICVKIPVHNDVPYTKPFQDNFFIKQEPLDLTDDEQNMENESIRPDTIDNFCSELPLEVKLEKQPYDEEANYGFSDCDVADNEEDDTFYEGNDYEMTNLEDDEVIDSKDNIFDPLVVKDDNDFYRTHSILEAFLDDDPGNRSDYSYEPSGEDDDDFYEVKKNKNPRNSKSSGANKRLKSSFTCKVCGKHSKWIKTHINHMREKHPNDPYVKEKLNVEKARLIESREEMLLLGTPMRRTQCPICNRKGFKGFVSYNDHINGHKNIRSYVCGCGSAFTTRHNFVAHRKLCKIPFSDCQIPKYAEDSFFEGASRKPPSEPPMRERVCPVCNKTGFQLMINFMDHQNKHTEERPYKCGCGFNTNTLFRFTQHLKKYGCSLSSTEWPDYAESYRKNKEDKLKEFERTESKPTISPCPPIKVEEKLSDFEGECSKQFSPPQDIAFETMEFEEAEPTEDFGTDELNDSVPRSLPGTSNDNPRVRNNRNFPIPNRITLAGKKYYTCWDCDFKAVKTTLVYNHYESRHSARNFKCMECGKMFASERILKKHFRQMHQEMVKCDECDEIVPRIRLKRHKDYKHLRPFSCKECGCTFGRQTSLTVHIIRAHRKTQNPNVATCVLCEEKVDVRNQSFRDHIGSNKHWIYESRWLEYNTIGQIPCKICKNWKSRCIDTIFKHMYDVHNMGDLKCLAYLSTFGRQDPKLIEAMKKKPLKIKEEPSPSGILKVEERKPPKTMIIEDCKAKVAPKEKSTNEVCRSSASKTCFICFKLIPIVEKSSDKNIMVHINNSYNHHVNESEWLNLHGLQAFPCPDCDDCQSSLTLQAAIYHFRKKHGNSAYRYFEYLRGKFAPSSDSGEKAQCFICLKNVLNMREHINSPVHIIYERKWSKMKNISEFPCSCCDAMHSSIREAGLHGLEAHNQPFVEYLQFIEILFKRKTLYKKEEKEDKDDQLIFGKEYVPKDPYKHLVVPFDYFVHNSF